MSRATVYGIPNCDTVKRARAWLAAHGVEHVFHDFGKQGVPPAALGHWLQAVGRDTLVNRRGTTWRRLNDAQRDWAADDAGSARLLAAHASLIKRPVVEWPDGGVTVGFDEADWAARLHP